MRIVMVSDFIEGAGGVYPHVKNLSIALAKRPDIELHIVGVGDEDASKRKRLMRLAEESGFSLHLLKDIDRTFFGKIMTWVFTQCFYYPLWVIKKTLELKPDIVHIHGNRLPWPLVVILMRIFFKKIPLIFNTHGIYEIEISHERHRGTGIKRKINKFLADKAVAYIPHNIAVSQSVKSLIAKKTNSKIYVIPNGINLQEIQNIEINNQINIKHPSILFIGRLVGIKGVDILLKALPAIKIRIPDINVYIAGSGPLENELKELAKKLDIEENVNFLGPIFDIEKYTYIKKVDICVFPSRHEAFSIAILEAMACGKPIVASNVGGIPSVIGSTGLLFENENIKDLGDKIIFLLENEEVQGKMGEASRERAKDFTWDKITDRTVELYMKVTSKQNRQGNSNQFSI